MVERQAIFRLNREYSLLQQAKTPQFTARPSETDTLVWHYVIYDLPSDCPYYGGQYHGKLIFPREYPLKPPSILMCTLSGRFEVNKRLCLSMSDYHPETWNPSWRVETILLGLVSFMLDETDPATAGGIRASRSQRQADAQLSFFRNRRNKEFCLHFPELTDPRLYHAGIGFLRHLPAPVGSKSLKYCGITDESMIDVQTVSDLTRLLGSNNALPAAGKSIGGGHLVPWLAVVVLIGAWIASRLNSDSS